MKWDNQIYFLHTEYTEYAEAALGDLYVNAVLILKHEPSL